MKWMQPDSLQIGRQLGNPGLVIDRRVRIRSARPGLQRILAALSVHVEEPLGFRVIGLEHIVSERPRGREASGMDDLAEIALAKAQQRSAVHFGIAADEVMQCRTERVAPRVGPALVRLVCGIDEYRLRAPVLLATLEILSALEDQDPLAGRGEALSERSAARPAADHDHVVMVRHETSPPEERGLNHELPRDVTTPGKFVQLSVRARVVLVNRRSRSRGRVSYPHR